MAVTSDERLVAESVRAALVERSYEAMTLPWPTASTLHIRARQQGRLRTPRRGPTRARPQLGLLLSDLNRTERVEAAQAAIASLAVPWLVLAGAPRGPAWGAMYERGAVLVMPTSSGLELVCTLIDDLAEGRRIARKRRRRELIREWRAYSAERRELERRMGLLTQREEDVLSRLYAGEPVRAIAEVGEVTEATVRSQVRSILRKLQVNSQLAAVAALEAVHDGVVP